MKVTKAGKSWQVSRQWSAVSGQWPVVSGQWSVVSGQWPVASGQWLMADLRVEDLTQETEDLRRP